MRNETASREIESLDHYLQIYTGDYGEESHTAMMMAIKALEHEPKWIPVSERPKENGWYQCSVDTPGGPEYVMDLYYKDGKWLDNRRIDMFNTYSIFGYGTICEYHKLSFDEFDDFDWTRYVKAWMPLPAPYKAESEDRE